MLGFQADAGASRHPVDDRDAARGGASLDIGVIRGGG